MQVFSLRLHFIDPLSLSSSSVLGFGFPKNLKKKKFRGIAEAAESRHVIDNLFELLLAVTIIFARDEMFVNT